MKVIQDDSPSDFQLTLSPVEDSDSGDKACQQSDNITSEFNSKLFQTQFEELKTNKPIVETKSDSNNI